MDDTKLVEIRTKWIRHTPLLKLDECVDNAMKEYAAHLQDEVDKWKGIAYVDGTRNDINSEKVAKLNYLLEDAREALEMAKAHSSNTNVIEAIDRTLERTKI